MRKILVTCTLFLLATLGIHSTALGAIQLGLEAELKNNELIPDTANVNLDLSDHWTLRGAYTWNTEEIGLAALYTLNPSSVVSLYLGLGENDLTGEVTPGVAPEDKAAFIGGLEWNLSGRRSGFSMMMEAEVNAKDLLDPSGSMNELAPRIGVSLNYRFPPVLGSSANTATSDENTTLLAKIVTVEAPDEPFEGQVAVAAVVLNRTHSNDFPDSVWDVIYQPGQFKPAWKLKNTTPDATALKAAKAALQGSDPSGGALYFYNPDNCSEKARVFFKKHQVTARIGNHVFLK